MLTGWLAANHTDNQTNRQTDRQTETDRETNTSKASILNNYCTQFHVNANTRKHTQWHTQFEQFLHCIIRKREKKAKKVDLSFSHCLSQLFRQLQIVVWRMAIQLTDSSFFRFLALSSLGLLFAFLVIITWQTKSSPSIVSVTCCCCLLLSLLNFSWPAPFCLNYLVLSEEEKDCLSPVIRLEKKKTEIEIERQLICCCCCWSVAQWLIRFSWFFSAYSLQSVSSGCLLRDVFFHCTIIFYFC